MIQILGSLSHPEVQPVAKIFAHTDFYAKTQNNRRPEDYSIKMAGYHSF